MSALVHVPHHLNHTISDLRHILFLMTPTRLARALNRADIPRPGILHQQQPALAIGEVNSYTKRCANLLQVLGGSTPNLSILQTAYPTN